ncbi:hypothetical protein [Gordonia phage MerCougar]|nr:hypothetical protein [Gordonia phage MerCougar]
MSSRVDEETGARWDECGAKDPRSPAFCTLPKGHTVTSSHFDEESDMWWEDPGKPQRRAWSSTGATCPTCGSPIDSPPTSQKGSTHD